MINGKGGAKSGPSKNQQGTAKRTQHPSNYDKQTKLSLD